MSANINELLLKLNDSEKWPDIFRPDFIAELNDFADSSYSKNTIEGYLASLLIYHQITENMILSLIKISNFYFRCYLNEFETTEVDTDRKMFGQLIEILKKGPKIDKTDDFIIMCNELNDLRIKIVHRITLKKDMDQIVAVCINSKEKFDKIYDLYSIIYDNWRVNLHNLKNDLIENIIEIQQM